MIVISYSIVARELFDPLCSITGCHNPIYQFVTSIKPRVDNI